jgi:hypothetical protein
LYELFAEANAQVGVYSTAIFEGLAFNLDTYLLDLPGIHHMENLLAEPGVVCCDSAEALVDALSSEAAAAIDPNPFFRPNAIENIKRAVKRIRNSHQ